MPSQTITSDAYVVPSKSQTITSDAYVVPSTRISIEADAYIVNSLQNSAEIDSNAFVVTPEIIPDSGSNPVPNPQRVCEATIKQCLPCNDDPISNYSSEDPDPALFCAVATFVLSVPPLGQCGSLGLRDLSCTLPCCSPISDEDAYLCALARAQVCVLGGGTP